MQELKMPDLNNVLIAGNLTSDPTFRKTTNGTPVANFYIASNRKFKDNTGQWRENVCFVGVVAWYKLAESCYANLHKGSAVLIDGELQSRSLRAEDGTSRNIVEIKARRIQFLDRRPSRDTSEEKGAVGSMERAPSQESEGEEQTGSTAPEAEAPDENDSPAPDAAFQFGYRDWRTH